MNNIEKNKSLMKTLCPVFIIAFLMLLLIFSGSKITSILNAFKPLIYAFIFAYLCINCSKCAILVYLIPLVHGLSVGSFITVILYSYGFSAFAYVAVCIFMPKLVETLLLLSLCNKSSRYCKEQYGGQGTRRKSREVFPIWLYLLLFAIYFAIESLIFFTFRWLL